MLALCVVYFPPERAPINCLYDDYFHLLVNDILSFSKKCSIVICGDMNTRMCNMSDIPTGVEGSTGTLNQQVEDLINDACPISFVNEMCQHSKSQDVGKVNIYDHRLIDLC